MYKGLVYLEQTLLMKAQYVLVCMSKDTGETNDLYFKMQQVLNDVSGNSEVNQNVDNYSNVIKRKKSI